MLCEKKGHTKALLMLTVGAVLVAGVAAFMMGGSKRGRRLTKKARRIGREVEGLIRDEVRKNHYS